MSTLIGTTEQHGSISYSFEGPFTKSLTDTGSSFAESWNKFVAAADIGHLYQGYEHAVLKSRTGWNADFIWLERAGRIAAGAMLLCREIPLTRLSIAAVPCGPSWLPGSDDLLSPLLAHLNTFCRKKNAIFCRLDLRYSAAEFEKLASRLPPNCRVLNQVWSYWNLARPIMRIDISPPLEAIVAGMHADTRMCFRRSARRGVRVFQGGREHVPELARLMGTMKERKEVLVRDAAYFETLFNVYPPDRIGLMLAEAETAIVAASLVVCLGPTAWYLYGAYDHAHRRLYPNEALQVAMIDWARQRGCISYDLGGTCTGWPPQRTDKGFGVYEFKRRLGARTFVTAPYCDLLQHPILYSAVWMGENLGLPLLLEKGAGKFQVALARMRAGRYTAQDFDLSV